MLFYNISSNTLTTFTPVAADVKYKGIWLFSANLNFLVVDSIFKSTLLATKITGIPFEYVYSI